MILQKLSTKRQKKPNIGLCNSHPNFAQYAFCCLHFSFSQIPSIYTLCICILQFISDTKTPRQMLTFGVLMQVVILAYHRILELMSQKILAQLMLYQVGICIPIEKAVDVSCCFCCYPRSKIKFHLPLIISRNLVHMWKNIDQIVIY